MIWALSGDHFRSILPPKTTLKANKREQQKPSFYTIKVMVSRGRRPQVRAKTDQKGQPGKEAIPGTFFYDFCLFVDFLFDTKIAPESSQKLGPKKNAKTHFLKSVGAFRHLRRQAGTEKRRRGRAASQTSQKKKSCETPATTQTKLA